jgi:hypothetical protein
VFRTLLLLREFVDLEGRSIRVCAGAPFKPGDRSASVAERMRALRARVYALPHECMASGRARMSARIAPRRR